ncbi:MAG: ABC transporter ATP-binding protein [Alphaproteobacteria bacterium]|nr:MAG: ABC transporter ATP-binding protein [Alphaproteobacteria bacterium]
MPLLEIRGLSKSFGGLAAVNDLSFSVEEGEIHGLIGPNGAGKTTIFNLVSGYYTPTSGTILYDGRNIAHKKVHQIAALGLVRTFQGTTLFQEMTVIDNVLVGQHLKARASLFKTAFGAARDPEHIEATRDILEFMGLGDRAGDLAMNLSHGHQRALGIAVALAAGPRLLLLDEPFAGMNPEETRVLMADLLKVRSRGVTLLLVEHDMQAVMGLCDRITVVSFGKLLAEGTPAQIRTNKDVIEAYLGAA